MKKLILSCLCLALSLLAYDAGAALVYWDNNGTGTPGSGTWNTTSAQWATSSTLVASPPAYPNSTADAAAFSGGSAANAPNITLNSAVNAGGIFIEGGATVVTITGSGSITLPSGADGFSCGGSTSDGINIQVPLKGTGAQIEQENLGYLALYAANTYTGGTELTGGQLIYYNQNSSFGTGTITVAGTGNALVNGGSAGIVLPNNVSFSGTNNLLNLAGGAPSGSTPGTTYNGNFALSTAATTTLETGGTGQVIEIAGVISGSSALTVNDSGTLELGGVNTFAGAITIAASTGLSLVGSGSLNSGSYTGAIGNSGTFTNNTSASQTLGGIISGAGTLTQAGSGTLTLSAANTYTGNTTINGGILNLGHADTPGTSGPLGNFATNAAGSIILSGGTLQYSSANAHDYSGRFSTAANQQYKIDLNGQNVMFATVLASSGGSLTVSSSATGGTLTLNGDNTYTGNTTINSGTIALGTFLNPFGASNGTIILAGGNIQATLNRGTTNGENITNALSITGNSELFSATTTGTRYLVFGGPVSGTGGSLTITNTETTNGPAVFCVGFSNTATLNIPVSIGALTAGNLAQLGIWNEIAYGDQTYNGTISGNGNLFRSTIGAAGTGGRVILTGTNTYTGGTTNDDGEIACGISSSGPGDSPTSGPLGTGAMSVGNANAKISAYGGAQTVGNHVIIAISPFTFTGTNALTMSGNFDFGSAVRNLAVSNTNTTTLSGSILNGGLTVSGGNTLTLSGSNAYTGATTVSNNSTLALASTGSISNSTSLGILAGSTLDVSAIAAFNLSSSTGLSASGAATPATIKGASGGTVSLGTQPVTLTYDGSHPALSISQGTLSLNGNTFMVNGSILPVGDYTIVSQASGNISSSGSFSASGTAIGAGTVGSIVVSNGNVNLIIHTPPVAGTATYQRTANATLIIPISSLLTNATATNGGPLTLVSVSSPSTNGATVTSNTNYVFYVPPAVNGNVTDAFLYTVSDNYGATNQGTVVVTVITNNAQSVNITGMTTLGNGTALISFAGIPGYSYLIEATTNLTPTIIWTILSTNTAGTNGLFQYNDLDSTNYPTRYYRTATP